ncbi:MAG: diphthamide biosynthesis enzyme Dph2 [Euryarchaeota archaeon]|nr:diphthamide biosynthesis enzyme Dph2 [Euryarchaeota archaeon]
MSSRHWTGGSSLHSLFDLDLEGVLELIRKGSIERVGLQVPEGMKRSAPDIAREIEEETDAEVIISGDPCYGACDVDLTLCREVNLLIHIGHAEMLEGTPLLDRVVYLETRMRSDPKEAVAKAVALLESDRVGVITTVQHLDRLDEVLQVLEQRGIEGMVSFGGKRTRYRGLILGCNYEAARALDVDECLFVGTGRFHPLGAALATKKRVVAADPVTRMASVIDPQPLLRRRFGAIARAADAERMAVLVSKKPGQERMDLARKMMALGNKMGKEMYLVYVENIEPDMLINLGVGAAVSTACPRVALDDAAKYNIPLLTPPEFEILLGCRDDYVFDEIV